ncbi:hypothetical protein [Carboxylicivirga sp. M1479]|uniref:hypothetical protein n=1 Tax=Carboxylicivirga sp. M1479 TaxID=2594476 RepID=UPI001177673A|nr:hypothetical protein [Carboxylicivirga sp. M1479]TRX72571.1 hypothetical protein FNN09_01135 [Carboxylicivirga sp. M1479]
MKYLQYYILLIISIFILSSCIRSDEIKVMTFNMRYDGRTDEINDWSIGVPHSSSAKGHARLSQPYFQYLFPKVFK